MTNAYRDENSVPTLIAVSNTDGFTPVRLYADPVTHRLLVDSGGGGAGTVTSVSVVSANGISGSVATATTTPAITLTLGSITPSQIVTTNNLITASGNAATIPITFRINTVTNNSAATLTVTLTTGATDGQLTLVRVLDFSAAVQTINWVNTENSNTSVPITSNGSTTLPVTVGFQYNGNTSKWRCLATS